MKKLLVLISAFFVLVSFSACSKDEIPSVEERAQALLTGEISIDEMDEKGWIDEDLISDEIDGGNLNLQLYVVSEVDEG